MPFIKNNFGALTRSKLVLKKRNQKIKKHNQLDFGTLVLASYCYCGDNT